MITMRGGSAAQMTIYVRSNLFAANLSRNHVASRGYVPKWEAIEELLRKTLFDMT